VQLYYYIIVYKLTWIGPALFYIALNLTLIAAVRDYVMLLFCHFFNVKTTIELYGFNVLIFNVGSMVTSIPDIINFIYIMITFSVALYSLLLNHNNHKFKQIYYYAASLLGLYGMAVFALLIYNSYRIVSSSFTREDEGSFVIPLAYLRILIIIILLGHALPILWTFSIKKYIEMVTSLLSYLFYAPTYVNILQIFAFCRIDDLSWGTKGLDTDSTVSSVAK
jgi:chitin synthase